MSNGENLIFARIFILLFQKQYLEKVGEAFQKFFIAKRKE